MFQFIPESYQEIDLGLDFYTPQTLFDNKNPIILILGQQMCGRNMVTYDVGYRWAGSMIIQIKLEIIDWKLIQSVISKYHEAVSLVCSQNIEQPYKAELEPFVQVETKELFSVERR